jgi:hypothetical protein
VRPHPVTGAPARRAARAALAALALAVATPAVTVAASGAGAAGAAGGPRYIAAAEYFGDGSPTNMWNSGLSGAPQAFAQMRAEGFNTVGLVVPWGEFQTGVTPPRDDTTTFAELDRLIGDASTLGMGVILRLSYEWDNDPADQMPGLARFDALWSNPAVYSSWLDYIAAVHRNVARFSNVREAYISWEDLWQPIFDAQGATTTAQRLALATTTGFRAWLERTHSLPQVSFDYGTAFSRWSAVPTPPADQPSFKLMFEYEDYALIHRLFIPASKRFPGLTMETRVDVDPLYDGTGVVGSYTHDAQYQLPGATVTGMYFSPYMGDPSQSLVETSTQALAALGSVLTKMSGLTGGRGLFIFEYEIESNSPQVSDDPALTPAQIPDFVTRSEPLLHQYTSGYALWTYRDYDQSPLFNQSFALGSAGWRLTGGARTVSPATSTSYVALHNGARATQTRNPSTFAGSSPATVTFQAQAPRPTTVDIAWGDSTAAVTVTPGWHDYRVTVGPSSADALSVSAAGTASVTDVQMFWYTQLGDVYSDTGAPEVGAAALRAVNGQLTGSGG